ncbi:MAG: cytidylate kinase-like family protein [Clostridia bacterium]|nr:cytidylate kinase-like family protein [Clostridia bacterium]
MIRVITVSREFGSGGRSTAKLIADKLGWKFYNKELVEAAAVESGLSERFIEENGEYAGATTSLLFNLSLGASIGNGSVPMYDKIFIAQSNVIRKIAEEGNCVIVGRCADYILRERDDVLNIFIHSDIESRKKRILDRYPNEGGKKPIEKRLADKDKRRRVYYNNYTDQNWGDVANYHLALDSGKLGVERCAEIVVDVVKTYNG